MIAALVPVKRLDAAKSRLRPALDAEGCAELAAAMLADLVEALRAVPELGAVAVVTEDPEAARVAERGGAQALLRRDQGLNESLDAAAAGLVADGASALLVVLGDVAGARSDDLRALLGALAALGGRGVVLAPSDDGGTSALLRSPPDAIPSAFGAGSAARHRSLARAGGVAFRELALPSLRLDVDRAEDLAAFLRGPGAGPRTRALLKARGLAGGHAGGG
jgi:2-phospho-L-lactate guanylyltransferase